MQHILILGAGLSASSLIKYLLEKSEKYDWQIRLGDLSLETAMAKIDNHPRGEAFYFNVDDDSTLGQLVFNKTLIANAPNDLYCALGKNDQKIYVIPSEKMVIIRMGEVANPENPTFALSGFDNELWDKINDLYQ